VSKHGAGLLQRTANYASRRLTNSSAWQDVTPDSPRRHSQDCLLARSPALRDEGRGIFDQPEKNEFFNRPFILDFTYISRKRTFRLHLNPPDIRDRGLSCAKQDPFCYWRAVETCFGDQFNVCKPYLF